MCGHSRGAYHTTVMFLYLTTTAVFMLMLTLGGGWPLQARAAGPAPPQQSLAHQIDWQHPLRDLPHHAGTALASALPGSQAALSVQPAANFPSGCLNGIAYNVIVNGHTSWSAQAGNQKATVWYQWCPRWSGDSVGLNWAWGKIYQLSSCADISIGGPLGQEVGGAFLFVQTSWPHWANDGEPVTTYHTCAGGLVWDYSLTLPGNGLYKVAMGDNVVSVFSPCYC
jgi:hypothetical protein